MAVLFALLVVVVIGAAVVVALRRPGAGQLDDPSTDRPPTMIPDGPLNAADLRAVRFPVVFRGYRSDDVDALLRRLSDQLDGPQSPTTDQENVDEAPPA